MSGILIKRTDANLETRLGFARAVIAIESIVVTPRDLVEGATPIAVAGLAGGAGVDLTFSGGTDGERYLVDVIAALGANSDTTRQIEIAVVDPLWTMPGGGEAWLDVIEFVERMGLDEAVTATDDSGSGTIGRAYLIGALRDAQAEAEAQIAARYALPLATVPGVLKTCVADLARARLYRRDVPDAVAASAKAAGRLLERIAEGKTPLPLPAGVSAPSAASDAPIAFASGGRTYPDGLAGY